MQWNELIQEITHVGAQGDTVRPIAGIEYDSRRVRPGSVFVAMKGGSTDGNKFVEKAIAAGAAGILTDSSTSFDHLTVYHPEIPVLEVEHGRRALAQASAAFFGHPERALAAIGITGTNGKTTTAFLAEALLNFDSRKTVLVGTIEYHVAGEVRPSIHTTPESRDLFELIAEGVARGATELISEVSSHALDQGRAAGIPFDVAVFTNLTRDHLDYHQTMEKYYAAKRLLFDGTVYPAPRVAVINAHDDRARQLAAAARRAGAEVRTYGIGMGDWRAVDHKLTPGGAVFTLETPAGSAQVTSHLAGEVNILNLLAAVAAAHARGMSFDQLTAAIPHAAAGARPLSARRCRPAVHGHRRLRAHRRRPAQSHRPGAPDGRATPAVASSPSSAAEATAIAPSVPRWERPLEREATMSLPPATTRALKIPTPSLLKSCLRSRPPVRLTSSSPTEPLPSALAVHEARPNDVVLIAGKGHEKEQILADRTVPFDDAEVARAALTDL